MMAIILPWWRDRSGREQVMLLVMAVLLVVTIGWLGILRPLAAARATAAERLATTESALGDVKAMTVAIRAAEVRTRPASNTPVIERIGSRATEAGLTTERLTSDGDGRVSLRVPAVKPAILLRWIADIEARDGIIADRVAITRNGDATVAADLAFRAARR
jgi:general secretion pathway protein M